MIHLRVWFLQETVFPEGEWCYVLMLTSDDRMVMWSLFSSLFISFWICFTPVQLVLWWESCMIRFHLHKKTWVIWFLLHNPKYKNGSKGSFKYQFYSIYWHQWIHLTQLFFQAIRRRNQLYWISQAAKKETRRQISWYFVSSPSRDDY